MKVVVNGEEKEFEDGLTIESLLEKLHLSGKVMAAALNMEIVKQNAWATHVIQNGDKLELLDFVGGG